MSSGIRSKFIGETTTLLNIYNYAQLYGSVDECFLIQKFGENRDIDSGQTEDVWSTGGTRPKPVTAERFNITSTSTDDTNGGSGTNIVLVQGLDSNYDMQEEYLVMSGTSNVLTTKTYQNIHRILSATVGSGGANAGAITATGNTTSNVMATIPISYNLTQLSHYVVPRGYVGYIMSTRISAYRADGAGDRQAEVALWIQIPGFASFRTEIHGVQSGTATFDYPAGIIVREKSLIWFEALAAANNTAVACQYELLMINKDWVRNP